MQRTSALLAGAVLLAGCALLHPSTAPTSLPSLRARIDARAARAPGTLVEVAFRDLGTGDTLFIHADSLVHAASTMKLPVMMRLFRESDAGRLPLGRKLLLVNDFRSIVDGSHYALDPKVDGDTAIYATVGDSITIRDLIRHMITRSSNLATNTLIALADPDSVNAMMRGMGASKMLVLRGVEDQKAFDRGLNNMTTARDLAALLTTLETGRAATDSSTRQMRGILLAQAFNEKIPAGLPAGVRVAHKTGDITAIAHDAAIVYPPKRAPYVLVVLTKGFQDEKTADSLIANISRDVYQYATRH